MRQCVRQGAETNPLGESGNTESLRRIRGLEPNLEDSGMGLPMPIEFEFLQVKSYCIRKDMKELFLHIPFEQFNHF